MAIKFDTPVFTDEMNITNCFETTGVWRELDLHGYVGSKIVKVLLYFEVIGIHDDGTEIITCKIKPFGEINIMPSVVSTRYCTNNQNPTTTRDLIGTVEVWTNEDGKCEWYSEYAQHIWDGYTDKTITLQIKLKAMVD